jgi:hypothetical protein
MPVPDRQNQQDYNFHAYDFALSAPWTLGLPQPARDHLQFFSLNQDFRALYAEGEQNGVPNIELRAAPITRGTEVRDILALSFGGPPTTSAVFGPVPDVVITGGIHAREWIGVEMAYLVAEYLIKNYSSDARTLTRYEQELQRLVQTRRIHILPMLNPHGNNHSVFGPGMLNARDWRKNRNGLPFNGDAWYDSLTHPDPAALPVVPPARLPNPPFMGVDHIYNYRVPRYQRGAAPPGPPQYDDRSVLNATGIDLNRNFDTPAWGFTTAPDYRDGSLPTSDTYFGTKRSSETETKAVSAYLTNVSTNLSAALDYHSYSKLILYPGEKTAVAPSHIALGKIMRRLIAPGYVRGDRGDYTLGFPTDAGMFEYEATATLCDFAANINNCRSFVIELDPATAGEGGFDLPRNLIKTVFEKNIRGALALIAAAGEATTYKKSWFKRTVTMSSAEGSFLTWNVFGRGNQLPT